jgi:hypothetical protein
VTPTAPQHPLAVTWRVPSSRFSPGRLDYLLVNPQGFRRVSAFLLDTTRLSESALREASLLAGDADDASDHLAIVADLVLTP